MTRPCQCCNGTGIEADDDFGDLRRECAENGIVILPGDRVCLRDTARLCRVTYRTLLNWRSQRDVPRGEKEWDGTITYSFEEVAILRAMTSR